MKRTSAILLTALNAGLAAWVLFRQPPVTPTRPASDAPTLPPPTTAVVSSPPATSLAQTPKLAAAPAPQPFHWRQIESTDYRTYLQNLRAIGCPEPTIRDILTADVHALYDQRRTLASRLETDEFWRAGFGRSVVDSAELARLQAEEHTLLADLLGSPAESPAASPQPSALESPLRFAAILESKRPALETWWQRYEPAKAALLARTDQRDLTEAETAQFQALEAEQKQSLTAILSPTELTEFEVRNSSAAQYLRQVMLGLDVTEAEFRVLLEARKEFDAGLTSATAGEDALAARQAFQDQLQRVLGPERTALLERGQQPEFQEFFARGISQGLDHDAIERAWAQNQSSSTLRTDGGE